MKYSDLHFTENSTLQETKDQKGQWVCSELEPKGSDGNRIWLSQSATSKLVLFQLHEAVIGCKSTEVLETSPIPKSHSYRSETTHIRHDNLSS